MADSVRVLGEYRRTDRLWLVVPFWDEGEDWDAAQGTASLVVAPTKTDAEKSIKAGWTEVFELPSFEAIAEPASH